MAKVCLISLYSDLTSIGIRYLSSYLKSNGIESNVIFMPINISNFSNDKNDPTEEELDLLKTLLIQLSPDFIGISIMTNYFNKAVRITKELKKDFNVPIIYGGIHATTCPEECLEYADIVCIGEAEETLLELCKSNNKADDLKKIKGIYYKIGHKIKRNEIRPLEERLDKYPFPDYSLEKDFLILSNKFKSMNDINITKLLIKYPFGFTTYRIISSRGCPFSCTYCCNHILQKIYAGKGRYVRTRSIKNLIDEMLIAKNKFNVRAFRIMDDSFLYNSLEWFKEFNKSYKKILIYPLVV